MSLRDRSCKVRVLLVERTPISSELLADALRKQKTIEVVGSFSSGHDAVSACQELQPDVLLMSADLDEQVGRGLSVLRELTADSTVNGVLMFDRCDSGDLVEAFQAGAKAVFSRNDSFQELLDCLAVVSEGNVWIKPDQLRMLAEALRSMPTTLIHRQNFDSLSKREREVATLALNGLNNQQIAQRLGLSRHTIKNNLSRVFDKVGASNRMELMLAGTQQPEA